MSDKVKVARMNGTIRNEDSTLTADFCGYFPADKPKYTDTRVCASQGGSCSGRKDGWKSLQRNSGNGDVTFVQHSR